MKKSSIFFLCLLLTAVPVSGANRDYKIDFAGSYEETETVKNKKIDNLILGPSDAEETVIVSNSSVKTVTLDSGIYKIKFKGKIPAKINLDFKKSGSALIIKGAKNTVFTVTKNSNSKEDLAIVSDNLKNIKFSGKNKSVELYKKEKDFYNSKNKVKAPDFSLKDQDGNSYSLENLKGKKVFLNFWAPWCHYCLKEMPDIEKLYEKNKDKDLVILGVAARDEELQSRKDLKAFMKKKGIKFPVLFDTDGEMLMNYYVMSYPTSFLIDEEGYVVKYGAGGMSKEQLQEFVHQP